MDVTIIIQNKDYGCYLEECIQSVLKQHTDYEFEVIGIDAGSTDNSVEIYKGYPEISLLETKGEQAKCLNEALVFAKGKYFSWINSDDIYDLNFVQDCINTFKLFPEAAMVYGNVRLFAADGRSSISNPPPFDRRIYIQGNQIYQVGVMLHKERVIDAGKFNEKYRSPIDWELYLRLSREHPLVKMESIVGMNRMHGKNLSVRPDWKDIIWNEYLEVKKIEEEYERQHKN